MNTTTRVRYPTETMSQIFNFDQELKNWVVDNAEFIAECGIDAGDYFETSIESEDEARGFWDTHGERFDSYTDDMGWAKDRSRGYYEERMASGEDN